jgi:2-oxoglutarate ferredoxin oxidoreductase subunit delta
MPEVNVNKELCKECKICIEFCPVKIIMIGMEVNRYGYHYVRVTDQSKCIACMLCERYCPEFAITVNK